MNRQIREMKVIVDGTLEKELYFVAKKDFVNVFGDGLIISGIWDMPFWRVKMIAENKAICKYQLKGYKLQIKYS